MVYLVVYLKNINEFKLINDENNKLKNNTKANVLHDEQWKKGEIVFRGTELECLKHLKHKKFTETEDESEFEPEAPFVKSNNKHVQKEIHKLKLSQQSSPSTLKRLLVNSPRSQRKLTNDKTVTSSKTASSFTKKTATEVIETMQLSPSELDAEESQLSEEPSSPASIEPFNVIENSHDSHQSPLITSKPDESTLAEEMKTFKLEILDALNKQIEQITEIFSNRTNNSAQKKEVLYGSFNLVGISATLRNKFVTACMERLFTLEERKTGYIIEGKSISTRTPLDLDKVKLLKKAYFVKYNIPSHEEESEWEKKIKPVANRKCLDSSKKKDENDNDY